MSADSFSMTIDGAAVTGSEQFDVINPATEGIVASAPNCTQQELDLTVSAARAAQKTWAALPFETRKQHILALSGKIMEHAESLAAILTQEQGKPLTDATEEVMVAAAWLAETANLELPETVTEDTEERRAVTTHVPLGVVAGLVPWNFPIFLAMFKVGPALLAGNTMIWKPAPTTPLTTLKIGEIAREVLPAGVLNVISGDDRLGPWLTSHQGIDKISFTGSTATGKRVMASAAEGLKRITLELGGNDAAIVMPDVDVETVAQHLFWAAFKNTGQICIATKRLYIHEDIYEPLKVAMAEYAKSVKMGQGTEPDTLVGPLQNKRQYQRVLELIADAKDKNYSFLTGGGAVEGPGYFIPLTILDNPPEDARIVQEEQFGPILPLMKFSDVDEVIERANSTPYGLGASVWSQDLEQAQHIASRLEAGTVWINEILYLSPYATFGGIKQSGMGTENGVEGLLEFTAAKTVFLRYELAPPA